MGIPRLRRRGLRPDVHRVDLHLGRRRVRGRRPAGDRIRLPVVRRGLHGPHRAEPWWPVRRRRQCAVVRPRAAVARLRPGRPSVASLHPEGELTAYAKKEVSPAWGETSFFRMPWAQLKLSPQAQLLPAFGLSMVKPCFSIVSEKSMDAPSR
ncbi:hypothetical protein BN10_360003 [Phycicoccus elongatus Lp2]|uniref:Uncharacterized protein n=1 Tax=Phycicoccus elongatus Lp2 TaxID=1193181 RepID=N0E201_9MICO|nr:hypothetical protein BN10_360003 [Phycicoccus elongatus Lp2]